MGWRELRRRPREEAAEITAEKVRELKIVGKREGGLRELTE